jgi:membrane protein DedA with SNARE-associated domain
MVHRIVEFFLSIPAPLMTAAVFLVALGETAVLLGLLLPGELAVILGGAVASRGRVSIAGVLVAGILGAIAGDSIGFFFGSRYGRRYFRGKRRKKWSKARLWLRRRGASAVFLGRFTPFLRSIVPAASGASRMSYFRFIPWSVAAGVLWGTGSALLGYLVGKNYEKLERFTSRFHLVILAVLIIGGILYFIRQRFDRRRRRRKRRSAARASAGAARRKSA